MYSQIKNFLQEDQFSKPWPELMIFILSIINENPQHILIPSFFLGAFTLGGLAGRTRPNSRPDAPDS